jgi:hypothetical protein
MTVYEVLTVFLIAMLALASTVAIYIGLIAWAGGLYLVECSRCGHLTFSSAKQSQHPCAQCRHPLLMHPVHALLHPSYRNELRLGRR